MSLSEIGRRYSTALGVIVLCTHFVLAQTSEKWEAEDAILSGNAEVVTCGNASGGEMVKGLDGGENNSILFEKISVDTAGEYFVNISYYATNDKTAHYKLNGGEERSELLPASGDWCYQGGTPGDYTFAVNFAEGNNTLKFYDSPILDKIVVLSDTTARKAAVIYVSSSTGADSNNGLSPETAIQTLEAVNALKLQVGDSILFKAGDTFKGKLLIQNESGSENKPLFFSKFGEGDLPLLDGDGYLSTIQAVNSGYLHFSNLEIKNDGGPAKPGNPENVRYGIYFQNTFTDGTIFKGYKIEGVVFKNIYPTIEVTDDDNTGVNAHAIFTSGSWGDTINPLRFADMQVVNCYFTRTARHALVIKATNNLLISNNLFQHVGGAGMVIGSACTNILVEHNITDHTGSSIDSRMAGRGSGIWCFHTTNLTVQHNQFMYAKGIHDSYGMHIDIGNRNVVYQYNYSLGNEGGFVEILGENVNVGYRYNLSIADGWRQRGNRYGQLFWLAGWSGDPKNPIGSDSIFIYNNSIFVPDTISPGIWIESVSKNARIYNNIIHCTHDFGPVIIKNSSQYNDFDYNIWYGNIPVTDEDGEFYRGADALTSDPLFTDDPVTDSTGFVLLNGSPAFHSGKLLYNKLVSRDFDGYDNHGGEDYYGNDVSTTLPPNRGAFNGNENGVGVSDFYTENKWVKIYPNPVSKDKMIRVEVSPQFTQEQITIAIFDVLGKIQKRKIFDKNSSMELETNGLSGFYLLTVASKNLQETVKIQIH